MNTIDQHLQATRTLPMSLPRPIPMAGAQNLVGRYEVERSLYARPQGAANDSSGIDLSALSTDVATLKRQIAGFDLDIDCNEEGGLTYSWEFGT